MTGAVCNGQVTVELDITRAAVHRSRPVAVTVEVIEQPLLAGTVKLPVKLAVAPRANVAATNIGVLPVRSLVTTTFVNVMLPALLTVPL
jgi:hypothetical protein